MYSIKLDITIKSFQITSVMEFTVYKKTDDIDEEFAGKGAKKKKQKEKSPKNHLISGIVHSFKKII